MSPDGLLGFSPRDPDPGLGHAIGIAILMFGTALIGGLLLARPLLRFVRKNSNKDTLAPGAAEARAIRWTDTLLCAVGGVVAAGFVVIYLAWWFAGSRAGFIIHFFVALLFAGTFAALLYSAFWRRGPYHWRIGTFALAGSFAIMAVSVGGAIYPAVVIGEARSKAGNDPYCIALTRRQRPARSWEDLTFYSLDKTVYRHHAIFLVESGGSIEPFHWSYYAGEFLPGVVNWNIENRPNVACRPESGFAQNLSAFNFEEFSHKEFYFGGEHLRIPNAYRPRVNDSYVSIAASAPDFSPTPRTRGAHSTSVEIRSRAWLQSSVDQIVGTPPTGKIGDLIEVKEGLNGGSTYYRLNADGEVLTLIGCYESRARETRSQHRFHRDGRMYSFDHNMESLVQSSEMEQKLFDTFASFVTDRDPTQVRH